MAVGQEFLDMLKGLDNYYNEIQNPQDPFLNWEQITEHYDVLPSELEGTVDLLPKGEVVKNLDGTVRSYNIAAEVTSDMDLASALDSNIQPTKTTVNIPSNTTIDAQTGKVIATSGVAGGAAAGAFADTKKLFTGLVAVGIMSTLGKLIAPSLYDEHPEFFGEVHLSQTDPEKWASIVSKENEEANAWFQGLMKSNGDGTATYYVDQEAYAYIIKSMMEEGLFLPSYPSVPEGDTSSEIVPSVAFTFSEVHSGVTWKQGSSYTYTVTGNGRIYAIAAATSSYYANQTHVLIASDEPFVMKRNNTILNVGDYTFNNKKVYYMRDGTSNNSVFESSEYIPRNSWFWYTLPNFTIKDTQQAIPSTNGMAWLMVWGGYQGGSSVDGISDQQGATTPTFTGGESYADIIAILKQLYPDWENDSVTQNVVQPDGSVVQYVYVPVVIPQEISTGTETVPEPEIKYVTGTQTQDKTVVDPTDEEEPEDVTKTATKIIIVTETPTTTDTGEGETPPVVIPTGTASALFSVYNPSQSEINSFGGWLWSSNFVDQLLKMFNDPMQAIISLHKVFCTPSISGRDDIKVGYLNSGVTANVVDEQYVDVDCGTIQLTELFQNVFDYPPFTEVSLYLPFVGFVKLDVNDIMRGTMQVIYHIDVLTGACLADVKVTRDMFGGVIYQYSGDCSVHYPLSSGSYMGIVTAALGVAGSIASGGSIVPLAIGAKMSRARMSTERSGKLSGNAGAMGIKKPYLVIQRPQTNTANEFNKYLGKPANFTTKIGSATGFISCTEVHIENCNGTDSELAELESLLKSGILI